MKLVIVESPNKCAVISKYLGPDYRVIASKGHIRDLSTHGKGGFGIDIEGGFLPDWEISPNKKSVVADLRKAVKEADDVYLASDPDREGEAISYHLAEVLGLPLKTTKRMVFHEVNKAAVIEGMENPRVIDLDLVKAQEARRMEDRIIGFRASPLFKRKIGVESVGRVQSSTLGMIVDRQNEINAFVPTEYWTIEVELDIGGKKIKAALSKVDGKPVKISSKEEAESIIARLPSSLTISKINKEKKKITPKMAFSTSTLQQEAFSRFHFSNSKTQSLAQKLYEGTNIGSEHYGLITYIRVESTEVSNNFYAGHAVPYITETFGKEYVGPKRKDKKVESSAHEAIRPTGTHRTPEIVAKYVTPDEAKLYRLIYCRALASVMAPKQIESTSITLSGNGLDFSLSGSVTIFKGYEAIYGEFEDKDEESLPPCKEGEVFNVLSSTKEQKFTKPVPQYNEASIVKAMEEKGIGRPSTYANTIKTLLSRKYVTSTKGVLTPTESGFRCVDALKRHFPDIVSTSYTADMESKLDQVANGELSFVDAMNSFYIPFEEEYETAKKKGSTTYTPKQTGRLCPKCGKELIVRKNKSGDEFIGCSGFPKCRYIEKIEKEVEKTGELCPECGKPLIYKTSKKGEKFIGCSGYPTCNFTMSLDGKVRKKATPVKEEAYIKPCPVCKTGHLVIKQGKRKKFLGCTNFPKCHYHEWLNDENKK